MNFSLDAFALSLKNLWKNVSRKIVSKQKTLQIIQHKQINFTTNIDNLCVCLAQNDWRTNENIQSFCKNVKKQKK